MKSQPDYKLILKTLVNHIDEGVLIIDKEGKALLYNHMMEILEKTKSEDVLGKHFHELFPKITNEESTLYNALVNKKTTSNFLQSFKNQYGKEAITINTTIPIIDDADNIVGAIEIANDVTKINKMAEDLHSLQSARNNNSSEIPHYSFENLIGANSYFLSTIKRAKKAAENSAPVLIYGETGTGKELFAQSIHFYGARKDKPFLAQNCAALPDTLLESILFGTTKGGFTGAVDKKGLFEQANGGTLLLDEVSAMPYELQSKLLRVLQENYVRRIGGSKDIPVDVRIIATINEDANELIKSGRLRQDLYYRLNIITINIPPLRMRKDDIPLLANAFLERYNLKLGKYVTGFSKDAIKKLTTYDYPGNVRELENLIFSAVSFADNKHEITETDLEFKTLTVSQAIEDNTQHELKCQDLQEYLDSIEKSIITANLQSHGNSISETARALGLKRQTLQYKIKKYNISL